MEMPTIEISSTVEIKRLTLNACRLSLDAIPLRA